MTLKEREQTVKDLQGIVDNYSGSWQRFNVLDGALTLIKELVEENEEFRYKREKLIEERDTFREYAYNMQRYVENIKHKEEVGYEPSAARYAAEMEMWHVVALEKKKLTEENETWQKELIRQKELADKHYYELACEVENLRTENESLKHECDDCAGCVACKCDCANIEFDIIHKMQSMIKEECIAGGIWPAFVARVVEKVGKKLLEGKNDV